MVSYFSRAKLGMQTNAACSTTASAKNATLQRVFMCGSPFLLRRTITILLSDKSCPPVENTRVAAPDTVTGKTADFKTNFCRQIFEVAHER
jgi:hypothetical protein